MIRIAIYHEACSTGREPKLTSRLGKFEVSFILPTEVLKQQIITYIWSSGEKYGLEVNPT